ncbi:MAG: diadenylate cyclase CdaA [Oscillospiraceae bacterium]|jgi:diadenylate cyclase|nr:diadenylate cyclase CdaA [Oscillospiraceae bacterium]MBQ5522637.1 diadenylate cyclase CdaA [Oscillospiraceae bacterium]
MSAFENIISRSLNYMQTIGIADIVDILIVAFLIYRLILLTRKTNSYNLAKGLLLFLIALWMAEILELNMISFILRKATELGVVVLVILFQPELRHILEKIGSRFSSRSNMEDPEVTSAITQTVMACADMAESRTGALIVFERYVSLQSVISTGTVIDSEVSSELLKNIFYNKAPLHDGAVIVRDGRIAAAGCVLPLSSSTTISKDLGMRHRAGIGISEQSDALAVIVSEETGSISCAVDGTLKRHLKPQVVDRLLRKELTSDTMEQEESNFFMKLAKKLFANKTEEEIADEKNNGQ